MAIAKKFRNFSTEDFSWKWDGVEHTFPAGQEMYLEEPRALHFAKHLVDREMNKMNNGKGHPTNDLNVRKTLEEQCFPSLKEVSEDQAFNLNEVKKEKKVKKAEVEEFAELNLKDKEIIK